MRALVKAEAGPGLARQVLERVVLSPHDPERVYVCLKGQVRGDHAAYAYRSDDFGATWTWIGSGLPAAPVRVVVEDPRVDGLVYLANDLGVYVSRDRGATWSSLSVGLPTVPAADLAVHAASGTLVLATHGLSTFALDVSALDAE